jgi:hypothetical protein
MTGISRRACSNVVDWMGVLRDAVAGGRRVVPAFV